MIVDLGLVDYEEAYRVQLDMVVRRRLHEIDDSLVIAEHNAVITIGRSGAKTRSENLLVDEDVLGEYGIKVLTVDRGGDITLHAPGQLIVYPIVDLKRKARDLHLYMRNLEDAIIDCVRHFNISAFRVPTKTGVWVTVTEKIASIGIASVDWVTYHGLSLNVNVNLEYFTMIRLCGFKDVEATSMKEVLRKGVDIEEVKHVMVKSLGRRLGISDDAFSGLA